MVAREPVEESLRQRERVAPPLAKWGQHEGGRRKPPIEILAKAAAPHGPGEVDGGTSDDGSFPRIDGGHDPGLDGFRQEPHLVKVERPAMRRLEEPGQLGLEQRRRDGRAAHADEGTVPTWAGSVNESRHQALAGAGLAVNEHGGRPLAT
jgi:hypothetical protein